MWFNIISRFQRWVVLTDPTWADGPGYYIFAPLALQEIDCGYSDTIKSLIALVSPLPESIKFPAQQINLQAP